MLQIPSEFHSTISTFSSYFRSRTFANAIQLLLGAIICPGSRTVCNILRCLGLSQEKAFHKFHRVLNRGKYSLLKLSTVLLKLLITTFSADADRLVIGVDETIERRRGDKIGKKGVYRDPVRSSKSQFVKTTGLRWMVMMLLTELPWLNKGMYWALPFLSALCPSRNYYERKGPRSAKKLTDWARQFIVYLAKYAKPLCDSVYLVGDGTYATYELMKTANKYGIGLVGRLKQNSRLFHLPGPQPKGKRGPKPHMGERIMSVEQRLSHPDVVWQRVVFSEWYGQQNKTMLLTTGTSIWDSNKGYWVKVKWVLIKDPEGKLDPVLLATNDTTLSEVDIVRFLVRRWRVEVTFAEVRRHLGVETQRQWSDLAIERTTPLLMGLKSIVCLLANQLYQRNELLNNSTAWYSKEHFTFSDILYSVRQKIWPQINLPTSPKIGVVGKLKARIAFLQKTLALAAA